MEEGLNNQRKVNYVKLPLLMGFKLDLYFPVKLLSRVMASIENEIYLELRADYYIIILYNSRVLLCLASERASQNDKFDKCL